MEKPTVPVPAPGTIGASGTASGTTVAPVEDKAVAPVEDTITELKEEAHEILDRIDDAVDKGIAVADAAIDAIADVAGKIQHSLGST